MSANANWTLQACNQVHDTNHELELAVTNLRKTTKKEDRHIPRRGEKTAGIWTYWTEKSKSEKSQLNKHQYEGNTTFLTQH